MKKKSSIFIMVVMLACILTGCVMEKTREDIIRRLEKADVIKKDWKLEYVIFNDAYLLPDISSYDYIYTCGEETYMVRIQGKDKEGKYPVCIGRAVEIEETEWTDSEGEKQLSRKVVSYEIVTACQMQYRSFLWYEIMTFADK